MHSVVSWYSHKRLRHPSDEQNMYGAYVEVAAYSQAWHRTSSKENIDNEALMWLTPEPSQHLNVKPYSKNVISALPPEDFIVVCEVSEIEGPKSLFTIPQDIDIAIDSNSLAEKLMSVDYHSSNSGPFARSGDTQVILSNVVDGLHAFADYFVLYDISARGFVRPLCISYITTDKKKLMDYFYSLRNRFLEISRYLKYGNRRYFLLELKLYLEDLQIAKDNYVKKCHATDQMNAKDIENIQDSSVINQFANSIIETQHLLGAERPILEDSTAAALFWKVEDKIKTNFNHDLYQHAQSFVHPTPLHSPKLDFRKSGMENCKMRSIFELCSWGFIIGFDMMISLQKYYKRDSVVIYMENEDLKYTDPDSGKLLIGNHVIANVDVTFDIHACESPGILSSGDDLLNIDRNYAELLSFVKIISPTRKKHPSNISNCVSEADSDSSFEIFDDAIDDPKCFLASPTLDAHYSTNINWSTLATDGLQNLQISLDDVHEVGVKHLGYNRNDSPHESEVDSFQKETTDENFAVSKQHTKEAMQSPSLTNYIEYLTLDKPGYGITAVFSKFPCFPHLLYSLLIGRPVIIAGSSSDEELVRSVVQAFALFVPQKQRKKAVIPWCTSGLPSEDMNTIYLAGFCTQDHHSENNIRQLSLNNRLSVLNVTRGTYGGPQYTGNELSSLFKIKKYGWEDAAFILYLQSLLINFASYVYWYHQAMSLTRLVCGGEKTNISAEKKNSKALLYTMNLNQDDREIVKCFSNLLIEH